MPRITEDLIRKRAEHNECVISTLEELSLHQQDLEKIENVDKWCRDLKILYLQSNLIPKIENVGRCKKLEYLNLALNNIEKIENLEGCESLKKLDLTVNFVGELTSIESLRENVHFRELYLTGNPCVEFEGYKDFVIATLPRLKYLDGIEIEKSERILASQRLTELRPVIVQQQKNYQRKREREKAEARAKEEGVDTKKKNDKWYTDTTTTSTEESDQATDEIKEDEEEKDDAAKDKEFWDEQVPFTPESRVAVHEHMKKVKQREEHKKYPDPEPPKRVIRLQADDGRYVNVNEPKVDFELTEDDEKVYLDVAIYKHLDTSLCDVDVQPTHVKVVLKDKVLQLVLPNEVKPDSSTAKRSQITGHLLVTMPKMNPIVRPSKEKQKEKQKNIENKKPVPQKGFINTEKLEVDPTSYKGVDFGNVVQDKKPTPLLGSRTCSDKAVERPNSENFIDDPDVPPLL